MDEDAWAAALRANPLCYQTFGAYCDWLDETGDELAGPMRLLFDRCPDGFPVDGPWWDRVRDYLAALPPSFAEAFASDSVIQTLRVAFCRAWVLATEGERAAFTNSLPEADNG